MRHEEKYMISKDQAEALEAAFSEHMEPDKFDTYWVQNIYFDTDSWSVIRTSMDRPAYKEKMRLRCYGVPEVGDYFFLELKKKLEGIVYKRRISLPFLLPLRPLGEMLAEETAQIARELSFYIETNQVMEKMFIAYRRKAFTGIEDPGLRITFDSDIRYRRDALDFFNPDEGRRILTGDYVLMEIKTPSGIPLWLARFCSSRGIFGRSYSKYSACYTDYYKQKGGGKCLKILQEA